MLEPFNSTLMQLALAQLVILNLFCAPLGCWLLLYRRTYATESLAHGIFPGVVAAALIGLPLALGAGVGVVAAALLITAVARYPMLSGDSAVSITVTGLFGLGAVMALSPDTPIRVGELLFGDLLAVETSDLAVASAVGVIVLLLLTVQWRKLSLDLLQPESANTLGAGRFTAAIPLIALAFALIVAVQALGNLLTVTVILLPAATARMLCERLIPTVVCSLLIGLFTGTGGLILSFYLKTATAATITLTAVAVYLAVITANYLLKRPQKTAHRSPIGAVGGR